VAILTLLIKPCHHDARLYLVNVSRICAFLIAPTRSRRHVRAPIHEIDGTDHRAPWLDAYLASELAD
jgi:hypothetical protein